VNAVGRAYERLAYTVDYEKINLIEYLRQIIGDLGPAVSPCTVTFAASDAILFAADRAVLVGLILTELVSNAGKYLDVIVHRAHVVILDTIGARLSAMAVAH
jgi:two-component sensor histidine kinase